jgi:hypothetical protein
VVISLLVRGRGREIFHENFQVSSCSNGFLDFSKKSQNFPSQFPTFHVLDLLSKLMFLYELKANFATTKNKLFELNESEK